MTAPGGYIVRAMSNQEQSQKRSWVSVVLWILAVAIMFAAADYQEKTGPTKEFKGTVQVGGTEISHALVRSGNTDQQAPVTIPDPGGGVTGVVMFKRHPTPDPFEPLPMETVAGELQALLPIQPAAGKLEYYVALESPEGSGRIPEGEDTLILRYKDPVPIGVLVPHVICMFLALLIGVRTALGALFYQEGVKRLAWTTLALMTVGGMILGPIVQKYAFGAFWTGWPFGYDLTDNKTLIMWIVWVGVVAILWKRPSPRDLAVRGTIFAAAIVMLAVYVIPHSLRGSELDYEEMEVETGGPGVGG